MIQEHGGNIYAYDIEHDFSVNTNPLGMPEGVKRAVINSAELWANYPDHNCTELIKLLSIYEKVPENLIVCGNGADDLIYRIVYALRPKKALVLAPSFGEYKKALSEVNCKIREYILERENNFDVDEGILDFITPDIDMVFLCNPNNPTGRVIPHEILKKIVEKCEKTATFLVCDECFMKFTGRANELSAKNIKSDNIIVLNAFTKTYALAGLRIGYALFNNNNIAELVRNIGQYWSVSTVAQIAGKSALYEADYFSRTLRLINQERYYLSRCFTNFSMPPVPSEANFILFRTELSLDELLLRKKILIRNCSNYSGLGNGYFRIAVKTHEENTVLVKAVRSILNG